MANGRVARGEMSKGSSERDQNRTQIIKRAAVYSRVTNVQGFGFDQIFCHPEEIRAS
jgi:hypothetical protein